MIDRRKPPKTARRTQKRSILFTTDMLEQLEKLAQKRHITVSELVREFVEKGMSVASFSDNIDDICDRVADRVIARLTRPIERIIALIAKAGLAASMAFTLCADSLERFVPPSQRVDFDTSIERAKKEGIPWLRIPERELAESLMKPPKR